MVGGLLVNGFYLLGFGGRLGGDWIDDFGLWRRRFCWLGWIEILYCYICGVEITTYCCCSCCHWL